VLKTRAKASEFAFAFGAECPVEFLAHKVADDNQTYTQYASRRAAATLMLLAAVDDEKGPQLFRVDPAGACLGWRACAAGVMEAQATNWLEKKAKAGGPLDRVATVRRAIACLQSVLSSDVKAAELEVGLVAAGERFRVLGEEEVEAHLTALAEAD
jgi:20S proteasome subunit alpha 1